MTGFLNALIVCGADAAEQAQGAVNLLSHEEAIVAALDALLSWATVGLMRRYAPDFWEKLGGRKRRLVIVSLVSVMWAVIAGLSTGMHWKGIMVSALLAFSAAVTVRQATKPNPSSRASFSRPLSIRTKL
jgi:hypothetical protein